MEYIVKIQIKWYKVNTFPQYVEVFLCFKSFYNSCIYVKFKLDNGIRYKINVISNQFLMFRKIFWFKNIYHFMFYENTPTYWNSTTSKFTHVTTFETKFTGRKQKSITLYALILLSQVTKIENQIIFFSYRIQPNVTFLHSRFSSQKVFLKKRFLTGR